MDGCFLLQKSILAPIQRAIQEAIDTKNMIESLIELEFNVALKLSENPMLINVIFLTHHVPKNVVHQLSSANRQDSATVLNEASLDISNHSKYPIFMHSLCYIHEDNKSGDYARATLAILFKFKTPDICEFILDTDFAFSIVGALVNAYSLINESSKFTENVIRFIDSILSVSQNTDIENMITSQIRNTFFGIILDQTLSYSTSNDSLTWLQVLLVFTKTIKSSSFSSVLIDYTFVGSSATKNELTARERFISKLSSNEKHSALQILSILLRLNHTKCITAFITSNMPFQIRLDPLRTVEFIQRIELLLKECWVGDEDIEFYHKETQSHQAQIVSLSKIDILEDDKIAEAMEIFSNDSTLNSLLDAFTNFFDNNFEFNISLLDIVSSLCISPINSLFYYLLDFKDSKERSFIRLLKTHLIEVKRILEEGEVRIEDLDAVKESNREQQLHITGCDKIKNIILLREFSVELLSIVYCQCMTTTTTISSE